MNAYTGVSLRINAPEFFADADFVAWLNNGLPKLTWHQRGEAPSEYSDVVVLVDPSFSGEGSDSDMPQHIWLKVVEACQANFGTAAAGLTESITVRLTNLEG